MIKLNSPYHHAYCFIGPRGYSKSVLEFLEREWQIKTVGNPDCFVLKYETFGIDEARELSHRSLNRAFSGGAKVFIVSLSSATGEAQNALLKLMEEPPVLTHFFFVIPSLDAFIPTLRSRLFFPDPDRESRLSSEDLKLQAVDFLKNSLSKRISVAKKLADDVSDGLKTRGDVAEFLSEIIKQVYTENCPKTWGRNEAELFSKLVLLGDYIRDPSSSVKMIFDETALIVPPRLVSKPEEF